MPDLHRRRRCAPPPDAILAGLFAFVAAGCSDEFLSYDTRRDAVIYDSPSGRDLPERATDAFSASGSTSRLLAWEQTMTMRSTVQTVQELRLGTESLDRYGTGGLAGGDLVLTAYHNVHPPTGGATLVREYVKTGLDAYERATGENIHDDWFLRTRLKALGLDPLAAASRQALLQFFETNFDSWDYTLQQEWGTSEDKDFALLRTERRLVSENLVGLPPWFVSGPALFYDFQLPQTKVGGADGTGLPGTFDTADFTRLYHVNLDMGGWSPGTMSPPFSYERMVNIVGDIQEPSYVIQDPSDYVAGAFFTTNADTLGGSSGGPVHAFWRQQPSRHRGQWIAIHKACAPALVCDGLGEYGVGIIGVHDTIHLLFEPAQFEAIRRHRGNAGHPWFSAFCTPGDPRSCYDECHRYCVEVNGDAPECADNCRGIAESRDLAFPGPIVRSGCAGWKCKKKDDQKLPNRQPRDYVDLLCTEYLLGRAASDFYPDGDGPPFESALGLGVLGGPTSTGLPRNAHGWGLGAVGMICGPYSRADWSMNWDFIATRVQEKSDDWLHNEQLGPLIAGEGANLSTRTLTQVFSDFHQNDYLAPQPFQMCPPGFFMNGLHVQVGDRGSATFISGILGVHCVDSEEVNSRSACFDPASPSFDQYPCLVPTAMNASGFAYNTDANLDQELGMTDVPSADPSYVTREHIQCPWPTPAVVGLRVSSNIQGPTRFIELHCQGFDRIN